VPASRFLLAQSSGVRLRGSRQKAGLVRGLGKPQAWALSACGVCSVAARALIFTVPLGCKPAVAACCRNDRRWRTTAPSRQTSRLQFTGD